MSSTPDGGAASAILQTPADTAAVRPAGGLPNPPVSHLLLPKWLTARARAAAKDRGRGARIFLLSFVGLLFWTIAFGVLYRLLRYFRGVEDIGPLLAGKLLGLIFGSFLAILLLSNVITALSTFFLARDLDMLVSGPVDWLRLYAAKLIETALYSSWMVALMAVPILSAYGWAYSGGPLFPLVVIAGFLPFLMLPAVIGSAATLVLVHVFPARRTQDILSVIAVLTAGGLVLMFRLLRPERLARPEGFRSLIEFITVLRTPTSPMLPSEWLQGGIMGWLTGRADPLPFYLLWTTAGAFIVIGALIHRSLYAQGFSKAQESGASWGRTGPIGRAFERALGVLGVVKQQLVLKEVRVFFRDTTQWSQLILLAVLVVVYVFNIKYLPLRGEGITFFLRNFVPFLNLVLAGFVLASVAARFIFPGVSLEGRTFWLLRSSPLPMQSLLWAKFWVGTLPLLILAVAIVGITNYLLQVDAVMFAISLVTIVLLTLAIAALALGIGVLFPQFDTENAAQIPTSFGGLVFMMSAVILIGAVIVLEARPVLTYLQSRAYNQPISIGSLVTGFGSAAAVCIAATLVPIRIALARLERIER